MSAHLSNELLIKIFAEVRDDENSYPLKRWIIVTHVCRHWRNTALASPILWSSARVSGHLPGDVPFVRLCLQRAQNTPVDVLIEVKGTAAVISGIMVLVREHAGHIRRLKLQVEPVTEQLFQLDFSLPALEALELYATRDEGDIRVYPMQHFTPTPSHFPCLRQLALENVYVPWEWDPSILTPLTSLQLLNYWYGPGDGPSKSQLLGMLSTLSNLKTLTLVDSGWLLEGEDDVLVVPSQPSPIIHLPALRHLTLSHLPVYVMALITHLAAPLQTTVHLTFRQYAGAHEEGEMVQTAIMAALGQYSPTAAVSHSSTVGEGKAALAPVNIGCVAMSLSGSDDWTMEIQCRTSCFSHGAVDPLPLRINIVQDEEEPVPDDYVFGVLLEGALKALSPYKPECLHYAGSPISDADSIIPMILTNLQDIRRLEIETAEPIYFIDSLQECCDNGCIPAIQHLILTDLTGRLDKFEDLLREYISENGNSLESLVIKTVARADAAGNLEEVSISEDILEELEDVVDSVEVLPLSEAERDRRLMGRLYQHFDLDATWAA
ncbi:hypothetical protein OBBRIDRAFT_794342 [Obba rivulosa]|uniref:F-box domain-containing protein n=1 Tax=Obba rivulosa TaxID=1052685 RepID=A0A8E2AUD9_9APHY|nr:hypothetical protein OBBRIDRAFT_794342 [Obba rivulosa]